MEKFNQIPYSPDISKEGSSDDKNKIERSEKDKEEKINKPNRLVKRSELPKNEGGWGAGEDKLIREYWDEIDVVEAMSFEERHDVRRIIRVTNSLGFELSKKIIPLFEKRGMPESELKLFYQLEEDWYKIWNSEGIEGARQRLIWLTSFCFRIRRVH
ncbi:MAG: hypothetical protein WC306_01115 [Candidatus Paceibacterota bacterium]|jgi:hypothetical protein